METIIIIGFLFLQIISESLTDALDYIGWAKGSKSGAMFKHGTQLMMILFVFFFGYWYHENYDLISTKTIGVLICYTAIRFLFFDIFYNTFSGQTGSGTTSLFDKIMTKLKVNSNSLPILIVKFILIILSIAFMDKL